MEKKKKVKTVTYKTEYFCDENGCKGKVEQVPMSYGVSNNWGPVVPHRCNECGKEYTFKCSYPSIDNEIVE